MLNALMLAVLVGAWLLVGWRWSAEISRAYKLGYKAGEEDTVERAEKARERKEV